MLYLIGGASRAGKSLLARRLLAEHGVPGFPLDAIMMAAQRLPVQREGLKLVPVQALPQLPFDHRDIVQTALARVRSKSQYSSLPVHLCDEQFTLPQLQQVYEGILGEPLNKVSFRRKMEEMQLLEAVEGAREAGGAHRPAQLYRVRAAFRQDLALTVRGL